MYRVLAERGKYFHLYVLLDLLSRTSSAGWVAERETTADLTEARTFCWSFFDWYNNHHRHGGIAMLAPAQVHSGRADAVVAGRQAVLDAAWARNPERFVSRPPEASALPSEVWINHPPAIPSPRTKVTK